MNLKGFPDFLKSNSIYSPDQIEIVLAEIKPYIEIVWGNKKTKFIDIPVSFDIETTSFFRVTGKKKETEKVAIMYEWTFGIYGKIIIGRTWKQFVDMLNIISDDFQLSDEKRLLVYVHNLSFEFQFMRKWFDWIKVFSVDARKPVYALTSLGIEFRCSYLLSGYSLAKLGDELQTYKVKKLVGSLDYEKIRHSETVLTDEEISYCVNDVKVVLAFIAERAERDGDLTKIPLTKTGYVRNYCRKSCFYEPGKSRKKSFKRKRYSDFIHGMKLTVDEYQQLKRAFQGGFTHANPFYSGKVVENVTSYDFTSSYPAVMVSEMFPMGTAEEIEIKSKEDFERNLKLYCCLFDVQFIGLNSRLWFDSYISQSRCSRVVNAVINNGRIVKADEIITTVTEQDFFIIRQFYTWDKIRIANFRRYKKNYLPTDFIKAILKLYGDKTTLKGIPGKEVEYLQSKEMLNACYGMIVTDIIRDENIYTDHWLTDEETPEIDMEQKIKEYNTSSSRFLFYPWGVWVTAYARRNLFTGIIEFGEDYIYSDTDSVKVINAENHKNYIERYNNLIREQLYKALDFHKIPREAIEPETIKGIKKFLGVWDFDGFYSRFKTLGAKRYLVQYSENNKVQLTVSGLNKQVCIPYLCRGWYYDIDGTEHNSPFDRFTDDMYIPPDFTGKMTHTYIDEERKGVVTDYTGKPGYYDELSGIHLEKADYSLKLSREYIDYFLSIQTETL